MEYTHIIAEIALVILFLWSEYLGVDPRRKSNSIIQLLMCALTPKQEPPPTIVLSPLSPPADTLSPPAS